MLQCQQQMTSDPSYLYLFVALVWRKWGISCYTLFDEVNSYSEIDVLTARKISPNRFFRLLYNFSLGLVVTFSDDFFSQSILRWDDVFLLQRMQHTAQWSVTTGGFFCLVFQLWLPAGDTVPHVCCVPTTFVCSVTQFVTLVCFLFPLNFAKHKLLPLAGFKSQRSQWNC